MNTRLHPALFLVPMLLSISACSLQFEEKEANRKLDAIMARLKGKDTSATEFRDARKLHFVDLNGDGERDVVAFITIEGAGGGNNYAFYMSVLLRGKDKLKEFKTLQVGGKGMRQVNFDSMRVKNGIIEVDILEYGPTDPMCCPTIKGISSYNFHIKSKQPS